MMGLTASNTLSLVLYLMCLPPAVDTFTAPVSLPRILRVDLLIRLHRFLLPSFWIIPVTLEVWTTSPFIFSLVTRLLRNLERKYGMFHSSNSMLCLHMKTLVFNSLMVICWGSLTPHNQQLQNKLWRSLRSCQKGTCERKPTAIANGLIHQHWGPLYMVPLVLVTL
jgi:hypothetical protein